ncbi:MAG: hydroxyethylthiazole kinase [Victivallaceae bacterium]|nr:hydroxyethylthiazole kinase [Victivallaceae bacterium]
MKIGFSTLALIRQERPLVHAITNFVTANFCADVLLAAGASPMMADSPQEAADATKCADALYLNIGTIDPSGLDAMLISGRAAKERHIPVVFDPVGVGATSARQEAAAKIIREVRPDVVKGNLAEMLFLSGISGVPGRGVDAGKIDLEQSLIVDGLRRFASEHQLIAIATGKRDFITDGASTAVIFNDCPMLENITGTGCALGALCAACAIQKETLFASQFSAVIAMGVAGEIACRSLPNANACGTFKVKLLDAIGNLTDRDLQIRGKYEFLA